MSVDRTDPPPLDGALRFDASACAAAAQDFGHLVHHQPEGVLLPGSADDIAATIRWAAARGRTVAARGRGHSVFGRAQARDGIVVDMARLDRVHHVADDHAIVDAGTTWSEVLAATLRRRRTPPVLTDYLDLSVGGTLAVGGVGGTTVRFGTQADNVLELEVITGEGRKLLCSSTSNAELFDAVRAGLGQVAVITRATLKLVTAPHQVRRFQLSYADVHQLLEDQRRLASEGRFDAVQGAIVATSAGSWSFKIDAAKALNESPVDDSALLAGLSDERAKATISSVGYADYIGRFDALEKMLRANGQWFFPHPWLTTFVGDSAVESTVEAELAQLSPADLGTFGQIVLSPFDRRAVRAPLLRLPADERCFAFNLIRVPTTDAGGDANRLVAANRAAYERIRARAGTLYPVSAFAMSPQDWRAHFGEAWDLLQRAKQRFDPAHVLTPGYAIF